jgi:hypothetical protein
VYKRQLLISGPKADGDGTIIDLEPLRANASDHASTDEEKPAADDAADTSSGLHLPRYAPLAAAVTFAIVLGALAGAATTAGLMRDSTPPQNVTAEATRDLQKTVAHLSTELATLKSGINTAQRSATTQFGKLAERLDRTEKAQAEPTAKIAKIQETVDRLDKRQVAAATPPASDVTGSIATKQSSPTVADAHPPIAEGWRLRDFYNGRAIIESRTGMLYEVGPGANVPGLGRVESVKRENGKVVVLTKGGIITAALETTRRSYPLYRY